MLRAMISWAASAVPALLAGCALLSGPQAQRITGEPLVYAIEQNTGQLLDRDIVTSGSSFHKDEMVTIVVNNVFIKFLEQFSKSHVLVYAEVYDDTSDDAEKAYRKVLFNAENTAPGVNLGVADRVLYGPTPYKGYPIRIRFYIVQLAKDQKTLATSLIKGAGTVAQAAVPAGAAVVGVAVELAQTLNALTEDDFELRFDLTLFPTSGSNKWDISDSLLKDNAKDEPSQRQGKSVQMVMPLRTGPYVITKRELPRREAEFTGDRDACFGEASMDFDHTQEGFKRNFKSFDPKKPPVQVDIVPRYSGGYLYWIVVGPKDPLSVLACENDTRETRIGPGYRYLYRTRTYVVLTVLNGMPSGLNEQQMRGASDRDLKQIRSLLDNPDQLSSADRIGPMVDQTANSIKTAIETRRVALQAAKRVNGDPSFRNDGQYPAFWLQYLVDKSDPEAKTKNLAVLGTLSDFVLNLPPVQPDDVAAIQCLKQFDKNSFQAIPNRPGLFYLKDAALAQLKAGKCTQAAGAAQGDAKVK